SNHLYKKCSPPHYAYRTYKKWAPRPILRRCSRQPALSTAPGHVKYEKAPKEGLQRRRQSWRLHQEENTSGALQKPGVACEMSPTLPPREKATLVFWVLS